MKTNVELNGQTAVLDLYVVRGGNITLLGREWLKILKLDWTNLVDHGILEKMNFSNWATPIVPVPKENE